MQNNSQNTSFQIFINVNNLKKNHLAAYLGVSNAFITQLSQGVRDIPNDKLMLIKANSSWDSSMFDVETSKNFSATSKVLGNNNTVQSTTGGHNISGNGNKLNSESENFLELLKSQGELLKSQGDLLRSRDDLLKEITNKKDEQIDRLLSMLEKSQK